MSSCAVLQWRSGVVGLTAAVVCACAVFAQVGTLSSSNPEVGGNFGAAVASGIDADGDGVSDVVIGAPFEDPGGSPSNAGRAFVFSGGSGGLLLNLISTGEVANGRFGFAVSGIPDLDGDGRGDIIVGAPGEFVIVSIIPFISRSGGRVYVFSGATGAQLQTRGSPNAENGAEFGYAVAGVPDVDGDGRGDVIVGARREDVGSFIPITDAGRAYLYSGVSWTLLRSFQSPQRPANLGAPSRGYPTSMATVAAT